MIMARAITEIKKEISDEKEEQTKAVEGIMRELVENRDAILETIQILKQLHETSILQAVHAALEEREDIGAIAIHHVNQPKMRNVLNNGVNLFTFLGSIHPGQLGTILDGFGHGLKRLSDAGQNGEKQSLWKLQKRLSTPEVRTAMTTMVDFMDGIGEVFLRKRKESH
jgi:uncharacterized protein YjgD (DUF1641 family)